MHASWTQTAVSGQRALPLWSVFRREIDDHRIVCGDSHKSRPFWSAVSLGPRRGQAVFVEAQHRDRPIGVDAPGGSPSSWQPPLSAT